MTTYDAPPLFEFVQELSCDCGEQYLAKCKRKNSKETVIVEQAIVDVAPRSHIHRMNNNFEISKFLQACVTENILQIHEKVVFTNTRKQSVVALIKEDFESISLDTFLALQPNQQVSIETFVELASNMCRALQSVHQANVVHLNLQPSCFLINKSTLEVKLRNFGQSKIVSEKDPFIHGSLRVSSFTYISPEQTGIGKKPASSKSDIYALGIIFFEMLAGRPPFLEDDDVEQILTDHTLKALPSILDFNSTVPKFYDNIIQKMTNKEPDGRYISAAGIEKDLERFSKNPQDNYEPGELDQHDSLMFPSKIYGREHEFEKLEKAMNAVMEREKPKLVILHGASGTGRTALVQQLTTNYTESCWFTQGKFSPFSYSEIPYSAFITAMRTLLSQLLVRPETPQTIAIRERISKCVECTSYRVLELIPELTQILGNTVFYTPSEESGATVAFGDLLIHLMAPFCTENSTLCLYLQDLQWADACSFQLFKRLFTQQQSSLLLIASIRGTIEENSAVMEPLNRLKQKITLLKVKSLSQVQINKLISDTLNTAPQDTEELSQIISSRTDGNPMFVKELLVTLQNKKLLDFVRNGIDGMGSWQFNNNDINDFKTSDNMVDLLLVNLHNASKLMQSFMFHAACLGTRFKLDDLAFVYDLPLDEAYLMAFEAVSSGWLIHDDIEERVYVFTSAALFDAAYLLQSDRVETHFKIGKTLLKHPTSESSCFAIARQLAIGMSSTEVKTSPRETLELAKLYVTCGKIAIGLHAQEDALVYVNRVKELTKNVKSGAESILLDTEVILAQIEDSSGNVDKALSLYQECLTKAPTDEARLRVSCLMLRLCQNVPKFYNQGYAHLLKIFKMMPVSKNISDDDDQAILQWVVDMRKELKKSLLSHGDDLTARLAELKPTTNLKATIFLRALVTSIPLLFLAGKANKLHLTALAMVCGHVVLNEGLCEASGVALVLFGWVWTVFAEETERGVAIADAGMKLTEKYNIQGDLSIAQFLCSNMSVWKDEHYDTSYKLLETCNTNAKQSGLLGMASYAGFHECILLLLSGAELSLFQVKFLRNTNLLEKTKNYFLLDCMNAMQPVVDFLLGKSDLYTVRYATNGFQDLGGGRYISSLSKALFHLYTKEYNQAMDVILEADKFKTDFLGFHMYYLHHLVTALILGGAYDEASEGDKPKILESMTKNNETSEHYSKRSKGFLKPAHSLAHAELKRCQKTNAMETIQMYQHAVRQGNTYEFRLVVAFASKQLITMFQRNDMGDNIVAMFVNECISTWNKIGSSRMSTQIKDKYHTLLEDAIRNQEMFIVKEPKSVPGSPNVVVTPQIFPSPDAPVIRAVTRRASLFSIKHTTSQDSISLKTEVMAVTKMLLEKARAERCCVILAEDNEIKLGFKYSLVAEVKTGQMHPLQRNIPLANCEKELSMSIVNRVIDTQQATLTNNVREARLLLIQDQYLGDKGVNAVLCSPILLNGQLHGMLYFESCSEKAVFSEQQKEMVSAIIDATVQNSKLHKQMKQVNSTYEHFMPKEFLKYLNKSGSQNDFKESISRDMAISTADFKSILSLTENRNASDTFAFMNQFLTKITPHVIGNNGLVHRFVHDALICLYPETVDDALKSCVEMVNALRDTSTDRKVVSSSAAHANNDFRIGLHHGKVKLGTLALSEERLDLTVLSDSLQQTKMLQRLAKKFNVSILATNNIIDRITSYRDYKIGETTVHYCRLGKFCMRETNATNAAASSGGTHTSSTASVLSTSAKPTPNSRGETYELYEVYDPKWNTYLYSDERKKEFLKGVSFFQHRKFIAAMNIFAKLYKLNEHDQTSRFYMRVCKMYQQIDLPSNWDGAVLIDGNCEPNPISSKSNSFYLQTGITAFFHLGDEQVLSSGRDKEEEIRLLNDSLSEKTVTIKDMKAILNVKEQEIARLNEITELLIKEKKQEVEKVKHNLDKEKKKNEALEKRLGIDSSKKGGSGKKSDSNCFTWLSSSPPQPSVGKNKVVPVNPNGNNNRIGKYK